MNTPLIPIVVTAPTPQLCRRWQVLLASTGMRVYRPGESYAMHELPAIAVHIEPHDVWMSWALPDDPRPEVLEMAIKCRATAEAWRARREAPEWNSERIAAWDRWFGTLRDMGFHVPGGPGDVGWLEFSERDSTIDWRDVAESAAIWVEHESRLRREGVYGPRVGL